MPPKKDKSFEEEPSKSSKGSKAAPKTKATKATKAPKAAKAPKTPAPAPAVAHPLNPERDVRRRTRANPSPGLSERKAIDKEPSFAKKRSNIRRTAAQNAAASHDQDAEESTRTETPSASHSPELEESRSTSPDLGPQQPSSSRTPVSVATGSSSHQAAESLKRSARGTKRTRKQFDDSSDADAEDVTTERRAKRTRGDDQPFEHYSPIPTSDSTTQVSDNNVQATPQMVTIEHTEATPQTPTRSEQRVGEQRPASALSVTNNDTSVYFTPQTEVSTQQKESEISTNEQQVAPAVTPSIQGPINTTASSSISAALPQPMPAPRTAPRRLTMGPDLEHEAMMESLRRRQKDRPMPKSVLLRKTKPVEEVEKLHFSDASDDDDLEPLDADGLRTVRENAKITLANLAAEKAGRPKPYVWGRNPALQKNKTKTRKRSDVHIASPTRKKQDPHKLIAIHVQTQDGPEFLNCSSAMSEAILKTFQMMTEYPNEIKTAEDIEAACILLMKSKRLDAAPAVPSTNDNQAMVDQSTAGQSAASASSFPAGEEATTGDQFAFGSKTPPASQDPAWSLMSTVKSVVSKPFEFFGAGSSNADNQSGSRSNTATSPTPAGRFRRRPIFIKGKGKGKAPAVPLAEVNEFEEHSQKSRGKQRESILENASDDELPHQTQSIPKDLFKKPQRVRRRDKAYYERKYAVPPIDPETGNYVTARTFYAVPYPPSSDEESSSDEDFETGLPKGPRLFVMQVDKTEKEHLETAREKKERLEREAEEERKRIAEEAEKEKRRLAEEAEEERERLEIQALEDEDYLEWMPMDLDDLSKAHPKWWLFKKHRYAELRMARRYEMNRSFPGQEYPSDRMKRFLAVYHERSDTVGAFTSGAEVLTHAERVEKRKREGPPPPKPRKPPGYIREPKVFGSAEMIKWADEHADKIHKLTCKGCKVCKRGLWAPLKDLDELENEPAKETAGNKENEQLSTGDDKLRIPNDTEHAAEREAANEKENKDTSVLETKAASSVMEKQNAIEKEKDASDKKKELSSTGEKFTGAPQEIANTVEEESASNKAAHMQSFFDRARGKTPSKNTEPEAVQTPTTIHPLGNETPVLKTAQELQLEAARQQALKHQPQVPSKLGLSPLFQSPLQQNSLQSSPLQHTPSPLNPLQTHALQEIQPNQLQRPVARFGGLMALHQDEFSLDNDTDMEGMLEDDPNEPVFKIMDEIRSVPAKEVYFT